MAVVRMSHQLKADIQSKALEGFPARERFIHDTYAKKIDYDVLKAELVSYMLEAYGMSEEMYAEMPNGWLPEQKEVEITTLNSVSMTGLVQSLTFDPPLKMATDMRGHSYYQSALRLEDPRFQKYADLAREKQEKLIALREERGQLEITLSHMCDRHNTMRTLLDEFPNLESLIPQWARDQAEAPTIRKKKEVVEPEAHEVASIEALRNTLASTLVKNTIGQALVR